MSEPVYFDLDTDGLRMFKEYEDVPRQVLNLPVRLNLKSRIDEQRVLEAMRLTVTRLPFCKIRLHKSKGDIKAYYSDEEPSGITVVDMSDASEKKIEKYIMKIATDPFDNKCMDSQLYNFKLIRIPDGKHIVFFCGYHIIMDSYGVIYVLEYFDKVYKALTDGTELPPEGRGVEEYVAQSWKYKGSQKEKKDLEWWCAQFDPEPHFATLNPKDSHEYVKGKNYGHKPTLAQYGVKVLPLKIPSELVNRINEAAERLNISPQLFYVLPLRTFLAISSGSDDVTLDTMAARRSTLVRKHCGMTPVHVVMWRSIIPPKTTVRDALNILSTIQMNTYRHADAYSTDYLDLVKAKYNVPENLTYSIVGFTYQPYFQAANAELEFEAEHVNSGIFPYPLYLNIMPRDNTGDLWIEFIYSYTYTKRERVMQLYDFMMKFTDLCLSGLDRSIADITAEALEEE